jgi:hypothetical protein
MDVLQLKRSTTEHVFLASLHTLRTGLRMTFASPFQNVVGVHLVKAYIPQSRRHVEPGDSRVFVGDTVHELDVGDYTGSQLADRLGGSFDESCGAFSLPGDVSASKRMLNLLNVGGRSNLDYPHVVKVRCMEVEEHMLRARSHEVHNTGMADVFCGKPERLDYTVPKNSFHPIGKLSTLTLKLEDEFGDDYPLHGMNAYFLVEIRYLASVQEVPEGYVGTLAPGYNPRDLSAHLPSYSDSDEDA